MQPPSNEDRETANRTWDSETNAASLVMLTPVGMEIIKYMCFFSQCQDKEKKEN